MWLRHTRFNVPSPLDSYFYRLHIVVFFQIMATFSGYISNACHSVTRGDTRLPHPHAVKLCNSSLAIRI